MDTKIEVLSKISKEDIGTLSVILADEPNKHRFSIKEVFAAMHEYKNQFAPLREVSDEEIEKLFTDIIGWVEDDYNKDLFTNRFNQWKKKL